MKNTKTNPRPVPNSKNQVHRTGLNVKAFTLVELIVVITILAILGTIAFISLQGYSKSSRDSVRISDVSNMKTSLELFHLNAGKYPLPDDDEIVTYSGETLWSQGTFGSEVVSQLSRNMSEVPTDPLTDKEYIFSTANNRNEFEILTLLESDLALNTITRTNAATLTVTPRIDGNYNGVFIKTSKNIVPVPSIINSEVDGVNLTLDNTNIKSQVINLGENIPNVGNVNYNTGALTGLELIEIPLPANNASDIIKASVITSIQEAYTGCTELANDDIYEYILSISGEIELASVFDTVILKDSTAVVTSGGGTPTSSGLDISICSGGAMGDLIYEPTGTNDDTGLDCSHDIAVCNGTGTGYIIKACNQGAITLYTNQIFPDNDSSGDGLTDARTASVNEWAGGLYQWGNNAENSYKPVSGVQIIGPITEENSTYYNPYFVSALGFRDWTSVPNSNLWGDATDSFIARQGPCESGYHIPTKIEWSGITSAGDGVGKLWNISGTTTEGIDLMNALKLPLAGYRSRSFSSMGHQGEYGFYWTSSFSLTINESYLLYIHSSFIKNNVDLIRNYGFSIRCFKN